MTDALQDKIVEEDDIERVVPGKTYDTTLDDEMAEDGDLE